MINKKFSFSKINIIFFILIFLLDIAAFFYWGNQKVLTFGDETYTFMSANSEWKTPIYFETEQWFTNEDMNNYLGASELNPHFFLIERTLWQDHVPMFFWLFRLVSILFYGKVTKWIGLSLNFSFLLLFSLLFYYSSSKLLSKYAGIGEKSANVSSCLITLVISLCMKNTITMATLERPYMILAVSTFLLLMMLGKLYLNDEDFSVKKHAFPFVAVVFLGWLTHYYYLPFYVLVSGLVWLLLIFEKQWKRVKYHVYITVITGFIVSVIDPFWLLNLYWGRSTDETEKFYSLSLSNLLPAFKGAAQNLITTPFLKDSLLIPAIFMSILVFSSAYYFLWKNKKTKLMRFVSAIILADYLYATAIRVVNRESGRYFYASKFVWIMLFYLMAAYSINNLIKKQVVSVLLSLLVVVSLCLSVYTNGQALANKNIAYLDDDGLYQTLEDNYSDLSWIVVYGSWNWHWIDEFFIFFIPENIVFVSTKDLKNTLELTENEYLLITSKAKLDIALDYFEQQSGKEWEITETTSVKHRSAHKISVK